MLLENILCQQLPSHFHYYFAEFPPKCQGWLRHRKSDFTVTSFSNTGSRHLKVVRVGKFEAEEGGDLLNFPKFLYIVQKCRWLIWQTLGSEWRWPRILRFIVCFISQWKTSSDNPLLYLATLECRVVLPGLHGLLGCDTVLEYDIIIIYCVDSKCVVIF